VSKIFVKTKTGKKKEKIVKIDKANFEVWTKERPIKGRANKAVLRILAKYLGISSSQLEIVSGLKSKNKIVNINLI
jgi:uncharacterized protein YggU (UPF0235/DUF167 family)